MVGWLVEQLAGSSVTNSAVKKEFCLAAAMVVPLENQLVVLSGFDWDENSVDLRDCCWVVVLVYQLALKWVVHSADPTV